MSTLHQFQDLTMSAFASPPPSGYYYDADYSPEPAEEDYLQRTVSFYSYEDADEDMPDLFLPELSEGPSEQEFSLQYLQSSSSSGLISLAPKSELTSLLSDDEDEDDNESMAPEEPLNEPLPQAFRAMTSPLKDTSYEKAPLPLAERPTFNPNCQAGRAA